MTLQQEALQAFENAIKTVGVDAFKSTSMFVRGRREADVELLKKAA